MPKQKVFIFRAKFFLALTFSFLILGLGFSALATGLTISPVKVSHVIKPGETVNGTITLTNASEDKVVVEVNVNDFVPAAGGEGLQFVSRAAGVTTVRDWITIGGQQTFEFKKNEIKAIPYTIKAPLTAEPGSHFGVAFLKLPDRPKPAKSKLAPRSACLSSLPCRAIICKKEKLLISERLNSFKKGRCGLK